MDKKIILLTENFPYPPGEQFLEEEVVYWDNLLNGSVHILPVHCDGIPRKLPSNIQVDLSLCRKVSLLKSVFLAVRSLFSGVFLKEVKYLWSSGKLKPRSLGTAFKTTLKTFRYFHLLNGYVQSLKTPPVIYTYWFNTQHYAAALLKRKKKIISLVSRAHGFDVYEERRPNHYMPLKRQFIGDVDALFAISNKGKDYLCKTYGIPEEKVTVERLGVDIPPEISSANDQGIMVILSIAFCLEVKKINKIIEALELISTKKPETKFWWHHLGDGPLRKELEAMAGRILSSSNISWKFHGMASNDEVKKFFTDHQVDVFINTSESEGLPVSIMEAMSFEVPAIAPDIGGISELINPDHGILLSTNPTPGEICDALSQLEFFKRKETRERAKNFVTVNYNAKINYSGFVNKFSSGDKAIVYNSKPAEA